jgi:hypothetical protein
MPTLRSRAATKTSPFTMTRRARRGFFAALACFTVLAFLLHLNGTLSLGALRILSPADSDFDAQPLLRDGASAGPPLVLVPARNSNRHKHIRPGLVSPDPQLAAANDVSAPAPSDSLQLPDEPPPVSPPPTPRIAFIVLWSPDYRTSNYLPNFFASVGANPSIEVLLVKFDKYRFGGDACERTQAPGVPNLREVCVSLEEYNELHLEYVCGVWGCTQEQKSKAREVMAKRFESDRVRCAMWRLTRGLICAG